MDKNLNGLKNIIRRIIKEETEDAWETRYEDAKNQPLKNKIKNNLIKIFKDKNVLVRVADNFYWSNGSNGSINYSNLNHFINDIGYRTYADKPELLDNLEGFKNHILYSYASNGDDLRMGNKYLKWKYNPNDEFSW